MYQYNGFKTGSYQSRIRFASEVSQNMGCCNNDKGCKSASKSKPSIPWFALVMAGLVLLVLFNWQ
ncbi:hypothetical protein DA100_10960 [Vibrio sp. Hep-1b-8]|nr:hypothetical protein DA100_10960 [Vibrio sp. Hep-1b-8]